MASSVRLHWNAGDFVPCHGGDLPCAGRAWWGGSRFTCDRCGAEFEPSPPADPAALMALRTRGWVLDVPVAFPEVVAARFVRERLLPMQETRLRSLPAGDRRDELEAALVLLRREGATQNVVGFRGTGKGDVVGFQSTKRTTERSYVDLGKGAGGS